MTANASIEPGLRLFTSNRLELLAGKLADTLRAPLASPLRAEVVVVRNKGMERWLKLELARRQGVCANLKFPFPEAFGCELFGLVPSGVSETTLLDRETLTWRVTKALPEFLRHPGFESLANYLNAGRAAGEMRDDRKLLQLSARIANLYDQYLVFRPEMMLEWDAGAGEGWQPELWRAVSADAPGSHAAALWQRFHKGLAQPASRSEESPERISIFGVSALPPFYLGLFAALAPQVRVNLFLLQPSREYWGDITSPREGERILRRQTRAGTGPFEAHLEQGNRLLASMGYLGRDFLKLVLDAGDWIADDEFAEPGEDSLLHCVQSDILRLQDRGKDANCPPRRIAEDDDSIQVHSCHSPLREMEVLQDHLLDWFERDPSLTPRDIVVMTPDIEAYAPFVQAVFGAPEGKTRGIPFSLADRGARRQSHIVETFLNIVDLPQTRLGATTVLAVLEPESVRAKFDLSEADLERIRDWVERTNIRWGRDEEQRAELGLPKYPGNTWRAGFDRLLLGYSMAGGGERLFDGILPFDDIEGDAARVLGHFAEFAERLFATMDTLGIARSLDAWAGVFNEVLERFFRSSESTEFELQAIREVLRDLRRQREQSGFNEPVALAVVLERLRPALEEDRFSSGFLTGGVTFCGLKPMRSIPFKRVCLIGMNDGAFPRTTQHLSFDLMAQSPRLGDRSTREDDRYLFLETLLSAREKLYLSYVGQSVRDNKQAPPSVLVSELLDYVEQGFQLAPVAGESAQGHGTERTLTRTLPLSARERETKDTPFRGRRTKRVAPEQNQLFLSLEARVDPGNYSTIAWPTLLESESNAGDTPAPTAQRTSLPGACDAEQATRLPYVAQPVHDPGASVAVASTLREHLVIQHRLQAFHEDYFRASSRLFSYSTENCRASEFTRQPRDVPALFLPAAVGEPEAAFRQITLQDLADFLGNASKFFLNRRLGIFLPEGEAKLAEREPFVLDGLPEFRLKQELLEDLRTGESASAARPRQQASGDLPLGMVGDVDYRQTAVRADAFRQRLADEGLLDWIEPLDVDLTLGDFRLTGRIAPRTQSGPLLYRCAKMKAKEVLRGWVLHLAASAIVPGNQTIVVAENEVRRFAAPADPTDLLRQLLHYYWRGLTLPLKFYPETSLTFAQAEWDRRNSRRTRKGAKTPIERAREKWEEGSFGGSEGESAEAHLELCLRGDEPLGKAFEKHAWEILEPLLRCQTREER